MTETSTPISLGQKPEEILDVVGIGSPLVDVIARSDNALLSRLGLIKGSMELVDLDQGDAI